MQKVSIICILFIKSYNQIRINYRTKLFYKIVYTDQEFDKVQNYYLMKNVQKYLYISKLINEKYINILLTNTNIYMLMWYRSKKSINNNIDKKLN